MSWTKTVFTYFGFVRPYSFHRSIATIVVLVFSLLLALFSFKWGLNGTLTLDSQRILFVAYIAFLLLATIFTLRWLITSYLFLIWVCIELTLLVSTYMLNQAGFPVMALVPSTVNSRFEYHPLLAAVPRKNWTSSSGLDIKHNSKGLRGAEIESLSYKELIHVYGGSTTYDVGVPNGSTWPEFLELSLSKNAIVANFGVPGYSSAEHVIQTAFYSDILERYPKCSIYYMGWNDIRNSHIPTLDKGYADFHFLSQFSNLSVRTASSSFSPIYSLLQRLFVKSDSIPSAPDFRTQPPSEILIDSKLEEIYRSNIRSIVAINRSRDIKTIFIGQVLNREKLNSEKVYGWLPLVRDSNVWPIQEHFNNLLAAEANRLGTTYVPIDINLFKDLDFVDNGHFSALGSKKFSNLIVQSIRRECI